MPRASILSTSRAQQGGNWRIAILAVNESLHAVGQGLLSPFGWGVSPSVEEMEESGESRKTGGSRPQDGEIPRSIEGHLR